MAKAGARTTRTVRPGALLLVVTVIGVPASAQDTVSEGAQWEVRPSQADFERLGPPDAVRARTSGRATLDCSLDAAGRLRDCSVMAESPAAAGFGASALRLASLYRLARTREVNLDGSRLTFVMRFRYPPLDAPAAAPTTAAAAASSPPPAMAAFTAPPGRMMRIAEVPGWQVEFLDLDRLTLTDGVAEAYRLTIYAASREAGDPPAAYEISRVRVDCRSGDQLFGGAQLFGRDGRVVASRPPAAAMTSVDPDGVEAVVGEKACDPEWVRTDATGFAEALSSARLALGEAP